MHFFVTSSKDNDPVFVFIFIFHQRISFETLQLPLEKNKDTAQVYTIHHNVSAL